MKDLLILYPHGLGDCILLTPAMREFYNITGNKVHIATLERFKSAKFFDNCPYVDNIHYTKDAWHDYPNSAIGFSELQKEWKQFAIDNNYGGVVMPMHSSPQNKIILNGNFLGIKKFKSYQTEIFTSEQDKEIAENFVYEKVGKEDFGFIQTNTGVPTKDLTEGFGKAWLSKNKDISNFIEIGVDYSHLEFNINVQFEIMKMSKAICVPDSVFYHACHAVNKKVDFVYFARGIGIHERVKPLHKNEENVFYKLEEL